MPISHDDTLRTWKFWAYAVNASMWLLMVASVVLPIIVTGKADDWQKSTIKNWSIASAIVAGLLGVVNQTGRPQAWWIAYNGLASAVQKRQVNLITDEQLIKAKEDGDRVLQGLAPELKASSEPKPPELSK